VRSELYIQYGCGLSAPAGWVNFDSSPRLRFERLPIVASATRLARKCLFPDNVRYGDIVAGLPVPEASAAGVYASHVLEHIARADVPIALANTARVLQPGGLFRMIVPDLAWRARRYLEHAGAETAGDEFIKSCLIGDETRPRGVTAHLRTAFGNSGHSWMYDEAGMAALLRAAGFVDIRRCGFNDSADPRFSEVEDRGRFVDCDMAELALEARRG
jgi:hypothetical protein